MEEKGLRREDGQMRVPGFSQIADIPESYVVNDGMETGIGNKIPLWLFGFLY